MWEMIASKWWRYSLGLQGQRGGEWREWGRFLKEVALELSFKDLVRWTIAEHSGKYPCKGLQVRSYSSVRQEPQVTHCDRSAVRLNV